tara:strand:+ start:1643 stop:2653 length:1011 start_codon:yes stop_codon:yes gene_type:complete
MMPEAMESAVDLTEKSSTPTVDAQNPLPTSTGEVLLIAPPVNSTFSLKRSALLHAQRALLDAYLIMSSVDSFGVRATLSRPDVDRLGDSIQDPFGTLYTAMMLLRLATIAEGSVCQVSGEISLDLRRQLAAVLTVAHKLCSSSYKHNSNLAMSSMQALMLPWELPTDFVGWERFLQTHRDLEMELVVAVPGISIVSDTPLYYAELGLNTLVRCGRMSDGVGVVLRGSVFFFLGACLLNPHSDVLQTLLSRVGPQTVGEALVTALAACFAAARSPPVRFKLECSSDIESATSILVRNGRADHAKKLRHGVFESKGKYGYLFERRVLSFVQSMFNQEH